MKILAITNLFPNSKEPTRGVFNKQQFIELAKLAELKVVAPLPWHYKIRPPEKETIDGIETYHPRYFMMPKIGRALYGLFFYLSLLGFVKKLHEEFNFDVILATWAYPDAFGSYLIAKALRKPIVIKVHGSDINLYTRSVLRRKMIVWALRNSNKVIAVSEALKNELTRLGVPGHKITVIQNGVDVNLFKPMDKTECRKKLSLPLDKKIVLYVGNFAYVKGVDILVEAFGKLIQDTGYRPQAAGFETGKQKEELKSIRASEAILLLVGDGEMEGALKKKVSELGIEYNVMFLPRAAHGLIPQYMNSADVFCLPSRDEGCPNVILEALSCGTPIVATKVGGIPEIITSSGYGVLVEPENTNELSKALDRTLGRVWNKEEIINLVNKFSWKASADGLSEQLENAKVFIHKRRFAKIKDAIKTTISFFIPKRIIIWKGNSRDKKIAFTFDDGPNSQITPKVLEILREHNAKATFFLVGREAETHSEIARDIVKEGHCIGAHSYTHSRCFGANAGNTKFEIDKSVDIVEKILALKCKLYRTPGGVFSVRQLFHCFKKGLSTAFWSVDSQDSKTKDVDSIIANVIGNGTGNGDIILFHDDNEVIVDVLPKVISHFKARGFEFVTVEEMLR